MDVHPSRELVASGQRAGVDRKSQAHVRIWSTESLQTLYVFGMGELNIGVTAVAFSQLVSFPLHFYQLEFDLRKSFPYSTEWRQLYSRSRFKPRKCSLSLAVAMGTSPWKSRGKFNTHFQPEKIIDHSSISPDSARRSLRCSIPSARRQPNYHTWSRSLVILASSQRRFLRTH